PRHNLTRDWQTIRLTLKAKLKRPDKQSMPEPSNDEGDSPEQITSATSTVSEPHPVPIPEVEVIAPTSITPTPEAPEGWEKLFAIGDDGRSIWLRFLPDNKT